MDDALAAFRLAKSRKHQEERVAIVIASILANPNVGRTVLLHYVRDRGKFATGALELMREWLFASSENNELNEVNVGPLILQLYRKAFPASRGVLLFYFAKHLSRYPHLNEIIRDRLRGSISVYLNGYRSDIEEMLDNGLKENRELKG